MPLTKVDEIDKKILWNEIQKQLANMQHLKNYNLSPNPYTACAEIEKILNDELVFEI